MADDDRLSKEDKESDLAQKVLTTLAAEEELRRNTIQAIRTNAPVASGIRAGTTANAVLVPLSSQGSPPRAYSASRNNGAATRTGFTGMTTNLQLHLQPPLLSPTGSQSPPASPQRTWINTARITTGELSQASPGLGGATSSVNSRTSATVGFRPSLGQPLPQVPQQRTIQQITAQPQPLVNQLQVSATQPSMPVGPVLPGLSVATVAVAPQRVPNAATDFSYAYMTQAAPSQQKVKPRAKRKQVKSACINCRKRKTGCDDERPCSKCVRNGLEATCIDVPRKKRTSNRKRSQQNLATSPQPVYQVRWEDLMTENRVEWKEGMPGQLLSFFFS
jgi:hypothetical protein